MDLNLIPPDVYSAVIEGAASLSAAPLAVSLLVMFIGGLGNNALAGPAQLSADLLGPVMPFLNHYVEINGGA